MKRLILLTSAAAVAFWGNALMGQTPNPTPAADQTKVQKRDRVHVPDGTGAQAQQKKQSGQAEKGQPAAKGKYGPADGAGNIGNRPQDGTGYGANSGNRGGPMDGTGTRQGDWRSGRQGGFGSTGGLSGSMGRGGSGGGGRRR
jgi:hypothetical protein